MNLAERLRSSGLGTIAQTDKELKWMVKAFLLPDFKHRVTHHAFELDAKCYSWSPLAMVF